MNSSISIVDGGGTALSVSSTHSDNVGQDVEHLRATIPNYDAECAIKQWINTLPTPDATNSQGPSLFPIKFVLELSNAQVICRAINVMVLEFAISLRSELEVFLEPEVFRERITKYYQNKMDRRYNRDVAIERMRYCRVVSVTQHLPAFAHYGHYPYY